MASSLTPEQRARRYLQASMEAGYTGLPHEHRQAKEELMRAHEREYSGVRRHALAGTKRHFDKPLTTGEREHQRHLRRQDGMQQRDVERIGSELDEERSERRQNTLAGRLAAAAAPGARTAAGAGGAAGGAISEVTGGGNTLLYFVGGALLLTLAYLLLKGGESAGGKLITGVTNLVTGAVRTFVAPVDPIAAAEHALGAGPIASASTPSAPTQNVPAAKLNSAGYTSPFAGDKTVRAGRIDQGQDFALAPGEAIHAIGPGKVTAIVKDWYQHQPLVAYELTAGPQKGHTVYVAEQISPSVRVGQRLKAGEVIGTYASSGTGIETGWALPSGQTLAQATTGYTEGAVTAAGRQFSSFLASLGVAVG